MIGGTMQNLGNRDDQRSFATIPNVNQARSKFNRSHAVKDTFDFDYLVPVFIDEILPGDTCNLDVHTFARVATQVVPVMDNMYLEFFFFFVPNRLLWDNWEKFNGAQDNPADSTSFTVPVITINDGGGWQVDEIYDHMGLPTDVDDITINALPLRAYNLIWNEWFRDENLQNSVTINTDNGPDATTDYVLLKRGKKHDYFTSALPWPYKGDATLLPLGSEAPVITNDTVFTMSDSSDTVTDSNVVFSSSTPRLYTSPATTSGESVKWGDESGLKTDLTNATAATINQFREAIMINSLLELDARAGTRYTEILRAHFGVTNGDARLQRPEFLSGGSVQINQHPIPQTSATSGSNYQADLAAYSTASSMGQNIGFSKSFTEHGFVIGLAQARGDITYQQGINRMWSRSDRYDYFWPKLQEMGEQSILTKELYAQGSTVDTDADGTPNDDEVWGYQERYAEYRYKPSEIRGQFRSTYASTLDKWHIAEEFSSEPALNSTFIESNTPIERSLAVAASYPHILFDAYFKYIHVRPMMTYGVPATLGRF